MLVKLATSPAVGILQIGYYALSVLMLLAWSAIVLFLLVEGAYQVGGLFVILTVLIVVLAYANERYE